MSTATATATATDIDLDTSEPSTSPQADTMFDRRAGLRAVLATLLEIWHRWRENSEVKFFTDAFQTATERTISVFSAGDIPGEMRNLFARVDTLREQFDVWVKSNALSDTKNPTPGNGFWAALEAIERELTTVASKSAPRRNLETIATLQKQNVPDQQICKIYGFTDTGLPNGIPILSMLAEEIAKPGTHTGPNWLPPHERRRHAEEQARQQAISEAIRQCEVKAAAANRDAPESIEELLLLPGISGKQIARLKKISKDEFLAYCDQNGLLPPAWESPSANAIDGTFDKFQDDAQANAKAPATPAAVPPVPATPPPSAEDIAAMGTDEQIVTYHRAGFSTDEIVQEISIETAPLSPQKVRAVIKRWKESPDSVEVG